MAGITASLDKFWQVDDGTMRGLVRHLLLLRDARFFAGEAT
jgi:hypothetical protein